MMQGLQIVLLVLLAPLLQGVIARLRARLQGRPGASILQPYRDLRKLWSKEAIVPRSTVAILAAPGVALGVAMTLVAAVPEIAERSSAPWKEDAVALALLLGLGRFVLVLAAIDTRSSFEAMAAGREIAFASLAEAPLILALLASAFLNDGNLVGIPARMSTDALSAVALVFVMLSETARVPVDNQQTHYELTMVHEGLTLEYSGWHLAAMQYAAYLRQAAFFAIAALLMPGIGWATMLWILVLTALIAVIEAMYAKMRVFEVPQVFTCALVLSLASIGLRIAPMLR
jgi:formate hydrogenlyase subunit 4